MTDTASPTEAALLALVAAIAASAAEEGSVLTPPERNRDLVTQMVENGDEGLRKFLNVVDGQRANVDELLGADLGGEAFDIEWHARIEFAVAGGTDADREAAFDAMRREIFDAIRPVVTGGVAVYLGGAVHSIQIVDMLPPEDAAPFRAGIPSCKASDFVVALTYTSTRPF
jgi:hypothetical protein